VRAGAQPKTIRRDATEKRRKSMAAFFDLKKEKSGKLNS
jgi:hypothetical protein